MHKSLLQNCSNLLAIRIIIIFYKLIYTYFGSGARHASYATFMELAKENNNGRKVGLIKLAETRMGGYYIALLQLLGLKDVLLQTVMSPTFLELKLLEFCL